MNSETKMKALREEILDICSRTCTYESKFKVTAEMVRSAPGYKWRATEEIRQELAHHIANKIDISELLDTDGNTIFHGAITVLFENDDV